MRSSYSSSDSFVAATGEATDFAGTLNELPALEAYTSAVRQAASNKQCSAAVAIVASSVASTASKEMPLVVAKPSFQINQV